MPSSCWFATMFSSFLLVVGRFSNTWSWLTCYRSAQSELVVGRGAVDNASAVVRFFLGTWTIVKWNFIRRMRNLWILGGSVSKSLLPNSGTSDLWLVCIWNSFLVGMLLNPLQAYLTANVSFSEHTTFPHQRTLELSATSRQLPFHSFWIKTAPNLWMMREHYQWFQLLAHSELGACPDSCVYSWRPILQVLLLAK